MHVALHALGEVVIDHLPDALEVHAARHYFGRDHYPALALPHSGDGIFPLLLTHARVETVDILHAAQHQLLGQG